MIKLSTAAQSVLNAYKKAPVDRTTGEGNMTDRFGLAAALREFVEQIAAEATPGVSTWGEAYYQALCDVTDRLRSTASELDEPHSQEND